RLHQPIHDLEVFLFGDGCVVGGHPSSLLCAPRPILETALARPGGARAPPKKRPDMRPNPPLRRAWIEVAPQFQVLSWPPGGRVKRHAAYQAAVTGCFEKPESAP